MTWTDCKEAYEVRRRPHHSCRVLFACLESGRHTHTAMSQDIIKHCVRRQTQACSSPCPVHPLLPPKPTSNPSRPIPRPSHHGPLLKYTISYCLLIFLIRDPVAGTLFLPFGVVCYLILIEPISSFCLSVSVSLLFS
ncbi:hypothetical protein GWI33_010420 [Rhynchophorus ferrugineus]|uniref:Uncharacterized protein n=1 Tax=Rhynchophorus ferrugineus TaxID=354439 RepID=A0A834MMB9_RHYFE|nr:hypothetical protein GWI33_010420 [Rhynchophorus ferrugineus]